tara:strand:- start:17 stop:460 length:444 start_codon:yes stop_codon:yes gene_type:complete
MNNYDYYGNYKNNNDYQLFSVNELQRKSKEKEKNRNKIYFIITKKCFEKIKETSTNDQKYCFYQVPEYIPGYPLYNMTECILYLMNVLKERGFLYRYIDKYIIYISWNIPEKNKYKAIENNTLNNIHLKYKPVEGNNFSNFIPRKKM